MEARLKGEESRHLRIAASASVLRNHIPDLLVEMRSEEPDLRLTLREVEPGDIHGMLMNQQVDVAVSIIYGRLTEGLQAVELLKLPLVLLVPQDWKVRRFSDVLVDDPYSKGKVAKFPLVGLPPNEVLGKIFQDALDEREINWAPSMEVDSLDLIAEYAVRGFGVGMGVAIPGKDPPDGLRAIRLQGFPPIVIGVLFQGALKPIAKGFLDKAKRRAKGLAKRN